MSTGVSCDYTWKFTEAQRLGVPRAAENIYYLVFGVTRAQNTRRLTHSNGADEIVRGWGVFFRLDYPNGKSANKHRLVKKHQLPVQ